MLSATLTSKPLVGFPLAIIGKIIFSLDSKIKLLLLSLHLHSLQKGAPSHQALLIYIVNPAGIIEFRRSSS